METDKILETIESLLGCEVGGNFDSDILVYINSAFSRLRTIGVGPLKGFKVTPESSWDEFIQDDEKMDLVLHYIYLKVKLVFDPPSNSFLVKELNDELKEIEWVLQAENDNT